jgi:hypothetical protein
MLRACSIFGLGALFLIISPKLRGNVQDVFGSLYLNVQLYAPFSYVALIILVLVVMVASFRQGAQPR